MKQFWDNTMSPTLTRQRSQLDKYFLADFDGQAAGLTTRVFYDVSNVKALQEDMDKKASRFNSAYSSKAVSKNEYRAQIGLEPVLGGDFIPDDEEAHTQTQERLNQQASQKPQPGKDDDQKKTIEMKRKPTELEAAQAPAVEQAQNDAKERLTAILLLIKAGLIQQGLEKLAALRQQFAELQLSLTAEQESQIRNAIAESYLDGGATAVASGMAFVDQPMVEKITSLVVSMLTISVAARMVSAYAIRLLRGVAAADILTDIETEMTSESPALYESLASAGGFQAVASGRDNEARRRSYKRAYYSAILDKNTCQVCLKDDGKWSDEAADLPPVPNPRCEGTWRCRCCIIFVFDEV